MSTEYHTVVDEFVDAHRHSKAEGTQGGYRHSSQHFFNWLGIGNDVSKADIEDIELTQNTIKEWLNDLLDDHPQSTTLTRYHNVSSCLNWLVDEGIIDQNPAREVDISDYVDRGYTRTAEEMRAKEGIIFLTEDEIQQLLSHVPEPAIRNELMVKLMLQTGLRPSELVSIRTSDIDRDERRVSVLTAKTGKIRDVWYKPSLTLLMNQWLDADREAMPTAIESNHVFITRYSNPMFAGRPTRVVDTAAENAGIQEIMFEAADGAEQSRITAKTLRHTFAVHSVRNGMDIRSLQMLMGHEKIGTTEKYLRFSDETLKQKLVQHGPDP